MVMGLTNASTNLGMAFLDGPAALTYYTNSYGTQVSANTRSGSKGYDHTVGVTTDSTKSGIVCDIGNLTITSLQLGQFIIKY